MTDPTQVNIRPLGSVVLVLPKAAEPDRVGSIALADVKHEPETSGMVVAVGKSFRCEVCRSERDPDVLVGDWVLFPRSAGGAVTLDGTEYVVLLESELLAVLSDEPACVGEGV